MNTLRLTGSQSKNINLLKGLSILFVVFIHADMRSMISAYMDVPVSVGIYMETLTRILVDNAVPMFFFVSGFLFFLREDSYANKFKSRFKTLLIPYLFWCLAGFLIPFVIQRILGLEHLYAANKLKLLKDFVAADYIRMFWDLRDGAPILSTLWFLRNLIVMVALTPMIAFLIKKLRVAFPFLLLVVYFFLPWGVPGFSTSGFCWFSMGAYFSLGGVNCWKSIENTNTKLLLAIWLLMTALAITAYAADFHYEDIMPAYRIVHFITIYHLIARISEKREMRGMLKIAAASFFIYVFHEPWMGYIAKLGMKIFQPTGIWLYVAPLLLVLLTVGYSYASFFILQKIAPRFLNIITGSRNK